MRRLSLLGVCLVAAACGGKSNSTVTDQGNTLSPKSAVAFSASAFFISIGGVMVTDIDNLCGQFGSGNTNSCNSSSSPLSPSVTGDSTSLLIAFLPAGQGTFKVIDPNAPANPDGGSGVVSLSNEAQATFSKASSSQGSSFSDTAVSGTVTVDDFKVGGSISGSYDLTMKSGAHLTGDFNGDDCPALDQAISSATTSDRSCDFGTSSSTSCHGSCSCSGKTVSANCSQDADGGNWSCTCTSASGSTTTCTLPSTTDAFSACEQDTSCCPYTF